ncbi:MAG: sialate O-acetylesterase [Planctomycetes bacterium]|nr:sialate O-acetylesterase [Planctomycetota bacterium]
MLVHPFLRVASAVLFALAVSAAETRAQAKLASPFGDHMVLQRGRPLPVWGTAAPGERVQVAFRSASLETIADDGGRWRVELPAQELGEPATLKITATNTLELADVLVGEVWLCSGQSNMEWSVSRCGDPEKEIADATRPTIRLYTAARGTSAEPQRELQGSWQVCAPETVKDFSATAYYFGRELSQHLGVPIGLIHSSWGGTPVEAWIAPQDLREEPRAQALLAKWEERITANEKQSASPHAPARLYNAMIAPLVPFALRGAIWYQGESNASRAEEYRFLFPRLLHSWRAAWGQGDFGFYFVQLANFKTNGNPHEWAELREAQTMTLALPATGMAVTIDIGNSTDIHPKNKQDVGKRLALWALAQEYGRDLVKSGPLFQRATVRGNTLELAFTHARGLATRDGQALRGFELAGADRVYHPAEARIEGERVILSSAAVAQPVAARYAWSDDPLEANLQNGAGLPASPFRSDAWPMVTAGRSL